MSEIHIRNLDDTVIEALRRRAEASGISTEEEARRALAAAVGMDSAVASQRRAEVRELIGKLKSRSTLERLAGDRSRNPD